VTYRDGDPISERWAEVDRIFAEALEVAVADRDDFLVRACSGDPVLMDTLSRLLEASGRAEEALSGPVEGLLLTAFGVDAEAAAGPFEPEQIGPYRLVRELKRGGMATVYEAERTDGAFRQRVAVKMLRAPDSRELARRFLAEREILSSLSHPSIAAILDGGTTSDGRHYLVMEFVEGAPITRWADARNLDVEARLSLFLQVADAVHFAHSKLVVHRDLKPSNVLVDAEGRVQLLDFGIAKMLEGSGLESGAATTRTATRWMTPEYAAPEQILGEPPGTATDVHGLGVLLHELLTGLRPFARGDRSVFEVQRAICEEVPPPMSRRVPEDPATTEEGLDAVGRAERRGASPARLRRILAGDLDAIVARALRKRPSDRYPSADALSDDVTRYLTGQPVVAREGLGAYRARKFVRRHRLGVAAAVGLLLVLASSSIVLARQGAEVARERDRAEAEAENARLVTAFLSDIFQGPDPTRSPGDTVTARELLQWGAERVRDEYSDRPALQADLLRVLAQAHFNLGLSEQSGDLHSAAVAARIEASGPTSRETAEALADLGRFRRSAHQFAAAAEALSRVLSIYEELGDDPLALAGAHVSLGQTLRDTGLPDSAEVHLRKALDLYRDHPDGEAGEIRAQLGLAFVLRGQDRLEEAAAHYEAGISRYRSLPDMDSVSLASDLNNFGYLRRVQEDFIAADSLYRESTAILEAHRGPSHPTLRMHRTNWARVLQLQGRHEEAEALLRENLAAARDQWPDERWEVGQEHARLAGFLLYVGRLAEAEEESRIAATIYENDLGADHAWTLSSWARVAALGLLGDDPAWGRSFLDRLHASLADARVQAGGLTPAQLGRVESLVRELGTLELFEEEARFASFLEPALEADTIRR
jgi:eukaryotic-like serine/threonine-protein kinase